jgi:hypothetical protein
LRINTLDVRVRVVEECGDIAAEVCSATLYTGDGKADDVKYIVVWKRVDASPQLLDSSTPVLDG